jgi:hypothetical protein
MDARGARSARHDRMSCPGLDAQQLATRSAPPSQLSLLGLVRHMTEMEHVYAAWALGPKSELRFVWGQYTDGGPKSDIDAVGAGNGYSLRWNLQKLVGEYARHNGHADLLRERIDGQTGE